jgi:alkylation response protein AidB-like acyl-CoA dehydrogenase
MSGRRAMDFAFSEEHELFRKSVSEFVEGDVLPVAEEIDTIGEFPRDLFKRMGELGYFGLRYPKEVGGSAGDNVMFCLMCEELANGSLSLAASAAMQCLMGTHFIHRFGTEGQRDALLKPALRGEKIGAFALTEPNAGSDLSAIETTAARDCDGWSLNGSKTWITNAPVADFFTVAAKTAEDKGIQGIDFFLVEKGAPGFSVGRTIEKLGVRGSVTAELAFQDCRVPAENILGQEGTGYESLREILSEIRVMTGALSLGLTRAALDAGLAYANERVQFGRPIGKFQAIRMKLAEMATDLEAARWLVYRAAWLLDRGEACTKEASMAKLFASEVANRAADETCRIFASYGYSMEYPAQRFLRDARFLLIGGGTSEILKVIIGKELGL